MTDIVAERYDLGVRAGVQVAKDMVAVRISPAYFERHAIPRKAADLL
ncbi:hypothetical protein VLK31_18815 [Variovorax sp. H27-G14]